VLALAVGCTRQPVEEAINPEIEHLLYRAEQALNAHEYHRAMQLADSVDTMAPDLAHIHFLRGRLYSELGRFDDAEAAYLQVLEIEPDYRGVWNNFGSNAYRARRYRQALEYYRREVRTAATPISLRGLGYTYMELGHGDSARAAFEQALAIDSTSARTHYGLALLHDTEGSIDRALSHALYAARLEPDHVDHQYRLGLLLFRSGRNAEAAERMRYINENWPWHHAAYYTLAQALSALGSSKEAAVARKIAEQLQESHANIEELELGRYDDAIRAYRAASYLIPDDPTIRNNIAHLLLLRGDTSAVLHEFRSIVQQDSSLTDIWLNLGVVYALSGQADEAEKAWRVVLRQVPGHPAATAYLARLQQEIPGSR
jgi:tetratricopeptide (TPR) repeat protein